jgi:hypothetical protein
MLFIKRLLREFLLKISIFSRGHLENKRVSIISAVIFLEYFGIHYEDLQCRFHNTVKKSKTKLSNVVKADKTIRELDEQ